MENARLQAEATAASASSASWPSRDIQTSFLPDAFPREPGWDVAAFYRAARQVGGDFYDFFPLEDHQWAVVVADVADKGVPAALFMALCRTLLRAVGSNRRTPAETLQRVNELLLRDTRSERLTIWYGLGPDRGCLTYSSAGHNPPLLVRADGRAEALSARGIALGVVPEIRLEEKSIELQSGDVLAIYTDGITEAIRRDKSAFGIAGLQSALVAHRSQPAMELGQQVLNAVESFVLGEPQFDDITLVVIKRLAADGGQPEPDAASAASTASSP